MVKIHVVSSDRILDFQRLLEDRINGCKGIVNVLFNSSFQMIKNDNGEIDVHHDYTAIVIETEVNNLAIRR